MKIGIDCRTILNPEKGEQAGVGYYTYSLVKNLLKIDKKNQYVLFFDWRVKDTAEFKQKNVEVKHLPFSQYKKYLPLAYSHMLVSAVLLSEKLDLFHGPANVVPITYPGKCVVTIHDLAIYKHPSWFPRGQAFSRRFLVPKSVKKAKGIIAVSGATKKDLIKKFKAPAGKISVVYEGVTSAVGKSRARSGKNINKEGILKKYKIADKYVLFVGTLDPRKNIPQLLRAFNSLFQKKAKKLEGIELVIAGAKGFQYEEVFEAIKSLKFGYKVRYLNYVPHDDKAALMKNASCFVFPTLYEGFGLPVLEAMSLGVPVITSKISSIPEITGSAAVLVNPESTTEIAAALKKVLGNKKLREKMGQAGQKQAAKFSWEKSAKQTLKVYQAAVKGERKEKKSSQKPRKSRKRGSSKKKK